MAVVPTSAAVPFEVHGSRFLSYVRPTAGSVRLAAHGPGRPARRRAPPQS